VSRFNDDFQITKDTMAQVMGPFLTLPQKNKFGQALKMKSFEIEFANHNHDISLEAGYFDNCDLG
jgi:hypothetical protein